MIVTPFGDLKWGDKQGLAYWLDAHNTAHWNLGLYASENKTPVSMRDLSSKVDSQWLSSHAFLHSALYQALMPASQSTTMTPSASVDIPAWTDEAVFYQWHLAHNALHRQLQQAIGST